MFVNSIGLYFGGLYFGVRITPNFVDFRRWGAVCYNQPGCLGRWQLHNVARHPNAPPRLTYLLSHCLVRGSGVSGRLRNSTTILLPIHGESNDLFTYFSSLIKRLLSKECRKYESNTFFRIKDIYPNKKYIYDASNSYFSSYQKWRFFVSLVFSYNNSG